jgi:hypothetical protein
MMRTIPIFQALIAADPDAHRNHGQLGYALKDSSPADLDGARRELDMAIQLRRQQRQDGWLYYELNRAALDISRDKFLLAAGEAPGDVAISSILTDLRAAAKNHHLRELIYEDLEIQDWIHRHALECSDLVRPEASAKTNVEQV